MKRLLLSCLLLTLADSLLAVENAPAPAPAEAVHELEAITVSSLKDPAVLRYRRGIKALEVFDRFHGLAPAAPPRFVLRMPPRQTDPGSEALTLQLVSEASAIDIPLAPDHSFSLPRPQQEGDENADLILNRKKGLYIGVPDIRTPGVPAHGRRLGDLRLECEMSWSVWKDDMNLLVRASLEALGGLCHTSLPLMTFQAPQSLSGATLMAGTRREALPAHRIGKGGDFFAPPLHDQSWPDDTLIEFAFTPAVEAP